MTLPSVTPIRPVRSKNVPVGSEWAYELKLDGFRAIFALGDDDGAFFTSKNGHRMRRFQRLAESIAESLNVGSAIFDGEIVVIGDSRVDFDALFFGRGVPSYAAFDLLWLDGRDLRGLPFWRRKKRLRDVVKGSKVGFVEDVDDPAVFDATAAMDMEGIVAKRRSDPYSADTVWVKVKHAGYSQMQGTWELFKRR